MITAASSCQISEEDQVQLGLHALVSSAGALLMAVEAVGTSIEVAGVVAEVVTGVMA